jgi:phosphate/sulfate permease
VSTTIAELGKEIKREGAGSDDLDIARIKIGGGIVFGVIALIVIAGIAVASVAIATFPLSVTELKAAGATDALTLHNDLEEAWFNNVKDLAQIWIVALLVPLLATVIAYIFGKTTGETAQS